MKPGEKPPALDAAAKKHDPGGALAFAFYYFASIDWAFATNDSQPISVLSTKGCLGCQAITKSLDSVIADGGKITGGRIVVSRADVDTSDYSIKSDAVIRVTYTQSPITTSRPSSAPSRVSGKTIEASSLLFVDWTSSGWRVAHLTKAPS